jgi:hypothetical protein
MAFMLALIDPEREPFFSTSIEISGGGVAEMKDRSG